MASIRKLACVMYRQRLSSKQNYPLTMINVFYLYFDNKGILFLLLYLLIRTLPGMFVDLADQ